MDELKCLTGKQLAERIMELAGQIKEEHGLHIAANANALQHARKTGEWLVQAKRRKSRRSKWGSWSAWLAKEYGIAKWTQPYNCGQAP